MLRYFLYFYKLNEINKYIKISLKKNNKEKHVYIFIYYKLTLK